MHTCMWSASPIVATPAMPEAPNLIQSWKITEEMIMAEMMSRLGLACRGQGLVNAQRYTMESRGGEGPGGAGVTPRLVSGQSGNNMRWEIMPIHHVCHTTLASGHFCSAE